MNLYIILKLAWANQFLISDSDTHALACVMASAVLLVILGWRNKSPFNRPFPGLSLLGFHSESKMSSTFLGNPHLPISHNHSSNRFSSSFVKFSLNCSVALGRPYFLATVRTDTPFFIPSKALSTWFLVIFWYLWHVEIVWNIF